MIYFRGNWIVDKVHNVCTPKKCHHDVDVPSHDAGSPLISKLIHWPPTYHKTARMFLESSASHHSLNKLSPDEAANNKNESLT